MTPLHFIVSPHPEGGWRVTGEGISSRGVWYDEAKEAADFAEARAGEKPFRIELKDRSGKLLKVRETTPI